MNLLFLKMQKLVVDFGLKFLNVKNFSIFPKYFIKNLILSEHLNATTCMRNNFFSFRFIITWKTRIFLRWSLKKYSLKNVQNNEFTINLSLFPTYLKFCQVSNRKRPEIFASLKYIDISIPHKKGMKHDFRMFKMTLKYFFS